MLLLYLLRKLIFSTKREIFLLLIVNVIVKTSFKIEIWVKVISSHNWDMEISSLRLHIINSGLPALGQVHFSQFYVYFNFTHKFKNFYLNFHLEDLMNSWHWIYDVWWCLIIMLNESSRWIYNVYLPFSCSYSSCLSVCLSIWLSVNFLKIIFVSALARNHANTGTSILLGVQIDQCNTY